MNGKNKTLLVSSILLTVYLVASFIYYLTEGDTLADFPVFAAFYLIFIYLHEALVAGALLFQWIGVLFDKWWATRLATFLMIVAALELALLVVPLVAMLPIIILNFVGLAKARKQAALPK
jgi:hypothetical protein